MTPKSTCTNSPKVSSPRRFGCLFPDKYCGGNCGEGPPLPIPNREVKLTCADGTAGRWESRRPPLLAEEARHGRLSRTGLLFLLFPSSVIMVISSVESPVWTPPERAKSPLTSFFGRGTISHPCTGTTQKLKTSPAGTAPAGANPSQTERNTGPVRIYSLGKRRKPRRV